MGKGSILAIVIIIVLFLIIFFIGSNIGSFSFDVSNIPILGSIQDFIVDKWITVYRFAHG